MCQKLDLISSANWLCKIVLMLSVAVNQQNLVQTTLGNHIPRFDVCYTFNICTTINMDLKSTKLCIRVNIIWTAISLWMFWQSMEFQQQLKCNLNQCMPACFNTLNNRGCLNMQGSDRQCTMYEVHELIGASRITTFWFKSGRLRSFY